MPPENELYRQLQAEFPTFFQAIDLDGYYRTDPMRVDPEDIRYLTHQTLGVIRYVGMGMNTSSTIGKRFLNRVAGQTVLSEVMRSSHQEGISLGSQVERHQSVVLAVPTYDLAYPDPKNAEEVYADWHNSDDLVDTIARHMGAIDRNTRCDWLKDPYKYNASPGSRTLNILGDQSGARLPMELYGIQLDENRAYMDVVLARVEETRMGVSRLATHTLGFVISLRHDVY